VSTQFHAKTLKGLENILADELREIGASEVTPVNRGVNFSGSVSILYKANLYLRTALRILLPVLKFKASNEEQVYRNIMRMDWSQYMSYKSSFSIDVVSFSNTFRNSHYLELKVKDAIVDQFRNKTSLRPSVDKKNAEIRINIHVQETFFTVSLDSSGESLHKRGYKKENHTASLSEVLAAGMILLTGWKGEGPLVNPMCGSGTIAIEAAMIAMGIYPGITGRSYAFQNWPDYDSLLFERILENMPDIKKQKLEVIASDIDPEAIRISKTNARQLGLEKEIKFQVGDFLKSPQLDKEAMLLMNPPYGERLAVDDIKELYTGIGTSLKHNYPGSEAWILTANMEAGKFVGLKPDRKIVLFNAGLECRFMKYTLFKGKRREFKEIQSA
jgi:putative N6-adenine-specific DNA methylase